MARAIVVDDEKNSRDIIALMLQKYHPGIEVAGSANCCEEGRKAIRQHRPDIVFIDIEMPDGNGFDLLRGLEFLDFEIIFITAYEKHFLHAIRFSEVAVILKPIDRESFTDAVNTVIDRINRKAGKERNRILLENTQEGGSLKIGLPNAEGLSFFPVETITWLEQQEGKTRFYLHRQNPVLANRNFRYYCELFSSLDYFQVNNTQMINLLYAGTTDAGRHTVQLTTGSVLEISPRRAKELSDRIKQKNTH